MIRRRVVEEPPNHSPTFPAPRARIMIPIPIPSLTSVSLLSLSQLTRTARLQPSPWVQSPRTAVIPPRSLQSSGARSRGSPR
jgi:hypothetical protein